MDSHRHRYQQLLAEVTAAMAPLLTRHRHLIRCAPRCSECCQALTLLAIEASVVAEAFQALPPATQAAIRTEAAARGDHCPFLRAELCTIYQARPLICRTHGLAIGYVDEASATIEVSACPRNFAEDLPLAVDDLLLLDPFNARLAALNQEFAAAMGLSAATRVAMCDLILAQPLP